VTDDPPTGAPQASRRGCGAIFAALIGVVLLLPGLCVIVTAFLTLPAFIIEVPKRLLHGEPLEPGFWLIMAGWAVFWLICLLVSYAGIRLIRRGQS
jgi:hypothetical protein